MFFLVHYFIFVAEARVVQQPQHPNDFNFNNLNSYTTNRGSAAVRAAPFRNMNCLLARFTLTQKQLAKKTCLIKLFTLNVLSRP